MISNNYFADNEEIQLYFEKYINWQEIVPLKENNFADAQEYQKNQDPFLEFAPANVDDTVEGYKEILNVYGEYMGKEVAPAAMEMDREGLKVADGHVVFPKLMRDKFQLFKEAGIVGYAMPRRFGGLNVPRSVEAMINDIMARSEPAFGITIGCFNLGEVINMFGDEQMKQDYVPKICAGDMISAMSLTEPNYGSNLPEIKTKAEQDENGNWFITGTKQFITHGNGFGKDIPSAVLTLARSEKSSGAKGLSFFLVESTDMELIRIEEKLGLHLSPTCQVAYDRAPAKLIGERAKGLIKYSMAMMNGARLGIAGQACGIAEAAYREAAQYASEREQFGKLIQDIPAVKRMLDEMKTETRAIRTMLYRTAEIVDLYDGYSEKYAHEGKSERDIRKDPTVMKYDKLAKFMTPMIKYYASELCIDVASKGIQIHGGSGYTEEYAASKIFRDSRITNIYEGTTQLQIVAAIGSVVEGMSDTGTYRKYLQELKDNTPTEAQVPELTEGISLLEQGIAKYKEFERDKKDYHAFDIVEMATHLLILHLLAEFVGKVSDDLKQDRLETVQNYAKKSKSVWAAALVRLS